ncbi:MerR family transcriptional regulator [bacterium SCSIO 12741]|nr:MerR family transcriptional regulator [bacterium SCSIO 12741]
MRKYVIKDLERLSGIKAHTIRIWEQRYGLLEPERTDTNIRYYKDNDLRKLLNVSLLLEKGLKISKISAMTETMLHTEVSGYLAGSTKVADDLETYLRGLIVAMIELDEDRFHHIFSKSVHEIGFQRTIVELIYPFLVKIGIMWGVEEINPAQEHFISCLIRQKMITAIDQIDLKPYRKSTFMLYLSQGEMHEIGLILTHYLLKAHGFKVIYLGQDVPYRDLCSIYDLTAPSHSMTIFTVPKKTEDVQDFMDRNQVDMPNTCHLYAGSISHDLTFPKNSEPLYSAPDFISFITPLA